MKKIIHHVHRHVHKIRRQPEHVRRRMLLGFMIVSAALLIFLWILSLGANLKSEARSEEARSGLNPLSALKDNFVSGYKSITE